MKFFLLFMFVSVAMAAEESEMSQDELARTLARALRIDPMDSLECVRKSDATIEDMEYMEQIMQYSDTEVTNSKSLRKASCVIVCCAQKMRIMVGGEVQVEELFKFFRKTGMPEDIESMLRDIARTCKEQVTDTSDECMAGFKFSKCMYQRVHIMTERLTSS